MAKLTAEPLLHLGRLASRTPRPTGTVRVGSPEDGGCGCRSEASCQRGRRCGRVGMGFSNFSGDNVLDQTVCSCGWAG